MATKANKDKLDKLKHEYCKNYERDENEIELSSYLLDEDKVMDKIASGDYPTLPVLADLQRKLGQDPKDPDAKDVLPFPPRRTKEEIFDAEKYKDKDEYAKSLVPGPYESGEDFATRLFSKCNSNLDKVRAAFYFVCTASPDDLTEVESESQMYRDFRQMRENSSAQAVFDCLVELAGVPNKRITGYKKGAGYESGLDVELDGDSWLACYVAGEWRFVDAFWGSQAVYGFEAGNFDNIDEEGNVQSTTEREGQRLYYCEEFYFLTDPEKLIRSHFPEEHLRDWQLLARPLSLDEFKKMPIFFGFDRDSIGKFQIIPQSHPLNVIVGGPGTLDIVLRETSEEVYGYETQIGIHKNSLNQEARDAIKKQVDVKGYISKPMRMGMGLVKFRFVPPCRAKFKLTIFLERTVDQLTSKAETVAYVEYVIHCPQENKYAKEIPVGSEELNEFGPGAPLLEAGFKTDTSGEIEATNGGAMLELELISQDERPRKLEYKLVGSENKEYSSNNLLQWINGTKVCIVFLSPDSGLFALVLYDGDTPLCQFLLDSPSEFQDSQNFHMPDFTPLGGLGLIDEELSDQINPVSHPEPYVVCEQSSLNLQFSMSIRLDIRAELLYFDSNGVETQLDDFVFVNGSEQGFDIEARFPTAGHYVVKIHTKREGSRSWKHFCNYFVRALGELNGLAHQFPKVGKAWKTENRLVKPLKKLLPINEHVHFSLQVNHPSVKEMYLYIDKNEMTRQERMNDKNKNESVRMTKNTSGLWQGSIKRYSISAGSEVKVLGGPNKNSCKELLVYRFETREDRNIRKEIAKRANELNEKRKRDERVRLRKQENHERKELAKDLLPEDPVKEEMERKKRMRMAEQMRLQEAERRRQELAKAKSKRKEKEMNQLIDNKYYMYKVPTEQQKEPEKRKKQKAEDFKQWMSSSAREARKSPTRSYQRPFTQRSEPNRHSTSEDSEGEAELPFKTKTEFKKELETLTNNARKDNKFKDLKDLLNEIDDCGFSQKTLSWMEPELSRASKLVSRYDESALVKEETAGGGYTSGEDIFGLHV